MARTFLVVLGLVAAAAPSAAQIWTDDFERPDGTDMGPSWTETIGDLEILAGAGKGTAGFAQMTHTSATGSYRDVAMEVSILDVGGATLRYVALIAGKGGAQELFTKLQDNDSDGFYETLYFYVAQSGGGGWGNNHYQLIATPVKACRMRVSASPDGDTLNVDLDADFDGTFEQHYENSGALALAGTLGTSFAVGAYNLATFDDWQVGDASGGIAADPPQLSLSAGGSQTIQLLAGSQHAGLTYLVLGTASGTDPGYPLDAWTVPLNFDAYTLLTLLSPNAPPLSGTFGTLDGNGYATASFDLPPLPPPGLAGLTLHHAYVVIELLPTLLHVVQVSGAAKLDLVP